MGDRLRPRQLAMRLALAALLASAGALAPGAGVSRRAVLGQAAAASGAGAVLLAPLLAPLAARAQELKQACRPRSALAMAAHPGAHSALTTRAHLALATPSLILTPTRAQASDAEVYRSASEGTLTPERVIERAAEGKLVLGEGGLGLRLG